jgi:hypothetical protein
MTEDEVTVASTPTSRTEFVDAGLEDE